MKQVAIVICNYNKIDYVLNCINSVKISSNENYDIYVVDNASTDGSADAIKKEFGQSINLIVNNVNLGGSGGFNTGIKEALKKDYKYVMLLDNDVILDKNAIQAAFEYMEENSDVAVVGSKLYSMDITNQIQELGANIDFENFYIKPNYR